jgi:hypothetical protein
MNLVDFPTDIPVVEYDKKLGLRKAVDQLIKDKGGWQIRMKPEGVDLGSIALIEDIDINNPNFFKAVFDELPYVSFGTHLTSERGEAFRFGTIEQVVSKANKGYHEFGMPLSGTGLLFYRRLIEYNLARLTQYLSDKKLPSKSINDFTEKTIKLRGWLNLIDVDLEVRERFGKTISRVDKPIMGLLLRYRNNMDSLRVATERLIDSLPEEPEKDEPRPMAMAEAMKGLPVEEIKDFIEQNQDLFSKVDMSIFYATYAIRHWLITRGELVHEQGLDDMLRGALEKIQITDASDDDEPVFKNLEIQLSNNSNRLPMALQILQLPYVREYLQKNLDIDFAEGEPKTLESVLRVHPKTKILFNPPELPSSEDEQLAYQFLEKTGILSKPRRKPEESTGSFSEASSTAFDLRWINKRTKEEIETMVHKPMSSARDLNQLLVGTMLTLYEVLKRDTKDIASIWGKIGLEEEFKQQFPQEDDFWTSNITMLEIYKMLQKDKEDNALISRG